MRAPISTYTCTTHILYTCACIYNIQTYTNIPHPYLHINTNTDSDDDQPAPANPSAASAASAAAPAGDVIDDILNLNSDTSAPPASAPIKSQTSIYLDDDGMGDKDQGDAELDNWNPFD